MARSLPAARAAFVTSMKRETTGPELTRLIAVLDDLIKWSVARPKTLAFHETDAPSGVLSFECAGSKTLCWSARVMRGDAPTLELYPPTGRSLSTEARARVIETLNAYSRATVGDTGKLRIGFGALKNGAAFQALTAVLSEVLSNTGQQVVSAAS